ncbi:TetR/AcrR family transcriptional regulator [Luteibacter sp. W1I16]|uniref:TetR/AcrR family transcriptional regulator n=1 Tax=Luteibacter sp. W1I16 TaxID=3373922 RepID=UPI003D1A5FB9
MVTSTPRKARRPGRPPAQPDGPDQRQRLVGIALELYARQGYTATTLAAIARAAGMTPAAVHYYFKTREQLFDTIFDEHIAPMRARIDDIFQTHANDPIAAFASLAERFVELAAEHAWMGPVFFGELLNDHDLFKQHLRKRVKASRQVALVDAIRRWQDEGRLNKALDPALLMTSVLSLTVLPMTARRKWKDDPLRKHIGAGEITRHAVALLNHGLAPSKA